MLTRLGEYGVYAFAIVRMAGRDSVVVSQRYIHPTPEAVECAFESLQLLCVRTVREGSSASGKGIRYSLRLVPVSH
jgi:hypothetical protein